MYEFPAFLLCTTDNNWPTRCIFLAFLPLNCHILEPWYDSTAIQMNWKIMEHSILHVTDKYIVTCMSTNAICWLLEVIQYAPMQSSVPSLLRCSSSPASRFFGIIWVLNIFLGLWSKCCLSKRQLQRSHTVSQIWIIIVFLCTVVFFLVKYCKWNGTKEKDKKFLYYSP